MKNHTFIVRVMREGNSSWQGEITSVEKDKGERFRSVTEMLQLMDSIVGADGVTGDEKAEPAGGSGPEEDTGSEKVQNKEEKNS